MYLKGSEVSAADASSVFSRQVEAFLRGHGVGKGEEKLVVGLSGGADSVCLLHVLAGLRETLGIAPVAVHVNHGIRGEAAERDQRFCEILCASLGVTLVIFREDVPARALRERRGLEETGRRIRYERFVQVCREQGAGILVLAHHRDDLAESLIMHLVRGSGLRGMGGMAQERPLGEIRLLRPLLAFSKADILSYLQAAGQSYCTDETNADEAYLRNRVRHSVMSALSSCNDRAAEHMAATARELSDVWEYLSKQAAAWFAARGSVAETGMVRLPGEALLAEPRALRAAIVRHGLSLLKPGLTDIGRVHVEAVLELPAKGGSRSLSLPGGIRARAEYGVLLLEAGEHPAQAGRERQAVWSVFAQDPAKKMPRNGCINWFDYDRIKGRLCFRTREVGDRICVLEGGRTKKLSDWMIDAKIPAAGRDACRVLAKGHRVLWVPGRRMAQDCLVGKRTRLVLAVGYTGEEEPFREVIKE